MSGNKLIGIICVVLLLGSFSVLAQEDEYNGEDLPYNLTWENSGGPMGGIGYDIRINPENENIMYVTDANAGAFKSVDGGKTWSTINKGLDVTFGPSSDNIPVFCLTIDHHNPETIWCGMQNQKGLFKTTNGGKTWRRLDKGIEGDQGITFRGITVHPHDPDIVYAAGEVSSIVWADEPQNGIMFDKTKGIVYKTTNGGKSWKQVWFGGNLARYIWINPEDPEIVYVSTGIFDREASNTDAERRIGGGLGILKSTNGGETWKVLDKDNGLESLYISSLYMHPEDPDTLLAGTGHDYYSRVDMVRNYPEPKEGGVVERGGVFLTTDGGKSWKRTLDVDLITAAEISESNPDIAYAANEFSCYRSEDGGRTWEKTNPATDRDNPYGPEGYIAGLPMDIALGLDDPSRIFINNYGGGNFFSDDGGKTWSLASEGYTGAICNGGIAVFPEDPASLYVAARSGAFLTTNGGEHWKGLGYEPARTQECTGIGVHPDNPDTVIMGSYNITARSTDRGRSWRLVEVPIGPHSQPKSIAFAPSNPEVVYMGTARIGFVFLRQDHPEEGSGILKSTDGGRTWRSVNNYRTRNTNVSWVEVHPEDPDTAYAATLTKGVFKTEDGGSTWERMFYNNSRVHMIRIHPYRDEELIVATVGGVYHSRNDGEDWERCIEGLDPEARVTSALFDPKNPSRIWASDFQTGVYYMDLDGSRRWKSMNDGLGVRAAHYLEFSGDGNHLYAGVYGGGVFRLDLNGRPPK